MAYVKAKRTSIEMGVMGGSFMLIMVGFSCFSWTIGYFFIKYSIPNVRYDRDTSVGDIVTCY